MEGLAEALRKWKSPQGVNLAGFDELFEGYRKRQRLAE